MDNMINGALNDLVGDGDVGLVVGVDREAVAQRWGVLHELATTVLQTLNVVVGAGQTNSSDSHDHYLEAKAEYDQLVDENTKAQRGSADRVLRIAELKVRMDNLRAEAEVGVDGKVDDVFFQDTAGYIIEIFLRFAGEYILTNETSNSEKVRVVYIRSVETPLVKNVKTFTRMFSLLVHPDKCDSTKLTLVNLMHECNQVIKAILQLVDDGVEFKVGEEVKYRGNVIKAQQMAKRGVSARDQLISHISRTCKYSAMKKAAQAVVDLAVGYQGGYNGPIEFSGETGASEIEMYVRVLGRPPEAQRVVEEEPRPLKKRKFARKMMAYKM